MSRVIVTEDLWKRMSEQIDNFSAEEERIISICKCLAAGKKVDFLYVTAMAKAGHAEIYPTGAICGECHSLPSKILQSVKKPEDLEKFDNFIEKVRIPLKDLDVVIRKYAQSFLERGIDPREHIKVIAIKIPTNLDKAMSFEKMVDVMKKREEPTVLYDIRRQE